MKPKTPRRRFIRPRYIDERNISRGRRPFRRRGWIVGWLRWQDPEPPFHYEHRWFTIHVLTWEPGPARKVQIEIKTYRTKGMRSVDGSKRYVRFGMCL